MSKLDDWLESPTKRAALEGLVERIEPKARIEESRSPGPPKVDRSPEQQAAFEAKQRMYQAALDNLMSFDDADIIAQTVGVERATSLIRRFGAGAIGEAMAIEHWDKDAAR